MIVNFDEASLDPAAVISHLKCCWLYALETGPEGPLQGYTRDALAKLDETELGDLKSDTTQLLVALDANEQIEGTIFYLEQGGNWYFWGLYVAPDSQGRGVGSALLAEVEARLPPATFLRATVDQTDQRVRHFYRRRGYQEVSQDSALGRRMSERPAAEDNTLEQEQTLLIIEKTTAA